MLQTQKFNKVNKNKKEILCVCISAISLFIFLFVSLSDSAPLLLFDLRPAISPQIEPLPIKMPVLTFVFDSCKQKQYN